MTSRRALAALCALVAAIALVEGHLRPGWVAYEDARELRDAMRGLRHCVARVRAHPSAPAAHARDGVAFGVDYQLDHVAVDARRRDALLHALGRIRIALADGEVPSPEDVARLDAAFAAATRDLPR